MVTASRLSSNHRVKAGETLGVPQARNSIWVYRLPSLAGATFAVLLTYWAALAFVPRRAALLVSHDTEDFDPRVSSGVKPLDDAGRQLAAADDESVAEIVAPPAGDATRGN